MRTAGTEPTPRQQEVLEFIRTYPGSPTIRDIMRGLGMRSPNGVACHLKALERKGCITRGERQSRSIRVTSGPAVADLQRLLTSDPEEMDGSEIVIGAYRYRLELVGPEDGE